MSKIQFSVHIQLFKSDIKLRTPVIQSLFLSCNYVSLPFNYGFCQSDSTVMSF